VRQSIIAVVESWGQFENAEEEKHLLLEAFIRRLVKTQQIEKTYCVP
jgi:hypothetical protein